MNKHLIKLALETLLEQLVDSKKEFTEKWELAVISLQIKVVEQEIKLLNI